MFKDAPPPIETPRPRRRRFWLLLVFLPVLTLALSGVVWLARVGDGLRDAVAEADRLDPRWRLEEIQADRATPPPGENAADVIASVKRLVPPRWPGPEVNDLFDDLKPQHQLSADQVAVLTTKLGLVGPALAEARSLIDKPRGRYAITHTADWLGTFLGPMDGVGTATLSLRYDVLARAQAGDADGAARGVHTAVNAGASVGDEPGLRPQIRRVAYQMNAVALLERILAQGEPSDVVLVALQDRLAAVEPAPLYLYGLRGERAGHYRLYENVRNGTVPLSILTSGPGGPVEADDLLVRLPGTILLWEAAHLQSATELVEIAKRPPEQWSEPLAALEARADRLPGPGRNTIPVNIRIANSARRNHAVLRSAVVAIAAERHRQRTGRWATTPDELVKAGLLTAVPSDPFTAGQPLKFVRRADGLTVYSVGENGTDDGGSFTRDRRGVPADVGFRLWDVAARRQPPLPPTGP